MPEVCERLSATHRSRVARSSSSMPLFQRSKNRLRFCIVGSGGCPPDQRGSVLECGGKDARRKPASPTPLSRGESRASYSARPPVFVHLLRKLPPTSASSPRHTPTPTGSRNIEGLPSLSKAALEPSISEGKQTQRSSAPQCGPAASATRLATHPPACRAHPASSPTPLLRRQRRQLHLKQPCSHLPPQL